MIPNRLAQSFAALLRDAVSDADRRQPTRLSAYDIAVRALASINVFIQDHLRDLRRLA